MQKRYMKKILKYGTIAIIIMVTIIIGINLYVKISTNKQIVTHKYHLYRALYIAKQLDLEAYGVGADPRQYVGATYRKIREILARDKDFIKCIFKPEPTYLGETIPVSGNGDVTND